MAGALVAAVLLGLLALAVQAATEADRQTLAASRVERTTSTTTSGSPPTSLGVAPTTSTSAPPGGNGGPPVPGAAGTLDAADGLSLTGIGPVTVGMTVAEAEAAAGIPIGAPPGSAPQPAGTSCTYVAAPPEDPLVLLMVLDGVVSRIDVLDGSPVTTLSGIGVGSSEEQVRDTYGYRIVEEPHSYDEDGAQLRYVADDDTYSLIFETHEGDVVAFRSGFSEQVGWVEGCS